MIYSVELDDSVFEKLWADFLDWKGSQEEFYFERVNPMKIKHMVR